MLILHWTILLAMERWKSRYAKNLIGWLDAWAEFEALSALACYAHEHPNDVFPEKAGKESEFEAAGLGHPLLLESGCVRNDILLGAPRRFYLVSGSNMAGKSTLLRSIGVNAVLAAAGAPVRARRALRGLRLALDHRFAERRQIQIHGRGRTPAHDPHRNVRS